MANLLGFWHHFAELTKAYEEAEATIDEQQELADVQGALKLSKANVAGLKS